MTTHSMETKMEATAARTVQIKHRFTDAVLFECEIGSDVASGLTMRAALEKATEAGANLRGANLSGAYLSGAYLRGAYLRGANLRGANLSGAYLRGAYLRGAYLRGADLRDADLRGAYLRDADLRGAYLRGADLRDADLSGADLSGADLSGADLSGAATPEQAVANLDRVREIILDNSARLNMRAWHEDDSWQKRSCAEETLCDTTHCLAGWLQVCSTDEKIRGMNDTHLAGILSAPVAASMFFVDGPTALEWLRERKYAETA